MWTFLRLLFRPINKDRIYTFSKVVKTGRSSSTPHSSHDAIGDLYNFILEPSLPLGCGSWGGNRVSETSAKYQNNMPKGLTAASGIDAVTHALEAYASILASDFTNGLALESLKLLFQYLPECYEDGKNRIAREKVHNASAMAGMAFSNAFLGICHSMAHKLGAAFHIPHGVANALLITEVIRYNASETPTKQAAFAQYGYPSALKRYAEIATAIGLPGNTDVEKLDALIYEIDKLKLKLGIPKSIAELRIDEKVFLEKIDDLAVNAFDDQCTGGNPRFPLIAELKQLYLNAYYGAEKRKV